MEQISNYIKEIRDGKLNLTFLLPDTIPKNLKKYFLDK